MCHTNFSNFFKFISQREMIGQIDVDSMSIRSIRHRFVIESVTIRPSFLAGNKLYNCNMKNDKYFAQSDTYFYKNI